MYAKIPVQTDLTLLLQLTIDLLADHYTANKFHI